MEVFETGELNFTCTPTFLSLMEVFEANELGGDGGTGRTNQQRRCGVLATATLPPRQKVSYGQLSSSLGPRTSSIEALWL